MLFQCLWGSQPIFYSTHPNEEPIYVANNLQKSRQNLDEDEFIKVEAYSVEELCDMIYSGRIEDSKTISAIMSYKDKYLQG